MYYIINSQPVKEQMMINNIIYHIFTTYSEQMINNKLHLREAIMREKCSFFNIVQKAFDPPPFRLNTMW